MSTKNEKGGQERLSLEPIFRMFTAYWLTQTLCTAIEHNFLAIIDQGKHTAKEIAAAARTSPRGTEMLLDALVGLELLTKKEGEYHLNPLSATFLVPGKPSYFGDLRFATVNIPKGGWRRLSEAVRTGKPVGIVSPEDEESRIWERMAIGVAPVIRPVAAEICDILGIGERMRGVCVLDIGGGVGAFGAVVAQRDPEAQIIQIEWENVNRLAEKRISGMGLRDRFSFVDGDFHRVDFGVERYDVILLSHLCHQESPDSNAELMRRIFRALRPGGALAINDFVVNDERTGPTFPLLFSLNMLVHTDEGMAYSEGHYLRWLREVGFDSVQRHDVEGLSTLLVARKG